MLEAEPPHELATDGAVLAGNPQPAATNAAARHQLAYDPLRGIDGDTETDSLRSQNDRRVDPHDASVRIDERAARISRVERDVALDDSLHGAPVACAHGSSERAHDPRRDGRFESEGIADRNDELPDAQA